MVWLFFLGMLAITLLTIVVLGYTWISGEYDRFELESAQLREKYVSSQKTILQNEVNKTLDYILYMRTTTETRLKNTIKSQVYQAHAAASAIMKEYGDKKNQKELQHMVREFLRPIRFNNDRGYYFATQLNGVEQLFADRPGLEGKNLINMQDVQRKYVIRDMIRIARTKGEGFYNYKWTKPDKPGNYHEKISFIKYFKPFNWFLGTGEYLEDVDSDIQGEILERIGRIRFGKEGYVFVTSFEDIVLVNPTRPQLIGKDLKSTNDPNALTVAREQKKAVDNPDGCFIDYHWEKPGTGAITPKMSFVKAYYDWRWFIGAGIYVDEIETLIAGKRDILEKTVQKELFKALFISLGVFGAIFFLTLYFTRRLKNEFEVFSSFLEKAASGNEKIDQRHLAFKEFRRLGHTANRMLEQRRSIESALKDSEERFRDLADLLPQTIFETDLEGTFTFMNRHAAIVFGYGQEDVKKGINLIDAMVPEDREKGFEGINRIVQGNVSIGAEYTAVSKDGRTIPALVYAAPIYHEDTVTGIRGIVVNISELKQVQMELSEARDNAEAANRAKSQFLANMSHEIRTPLNGIVGFTEILLEREKDPEKKEMLELTLSSCRTLIELINNILDLSKIEAEKLLLEFIDFDLAHMVTTLVKKMEKMAHPKHLELRCTIEKNLPENLVGDPLRIEQILVNLLNNAIKFTEKGHVEITLQKTRVTEDSVLVKMTVSDTGIGIASKRLNSIFEKFSQAGDHITRSYGGTGLGLAIVKKLLGLMDGNITVESTPGKGSRFTIHIPFQFPPEEPLPIPAPETRYTTRIRGNSQKLKLLVAEDNKINQKLIIKLIQARQWEADIVEDGEEVLEKLKGNVYDMILMDVQMPRLNGLDTTREIRKVEKTKNPGSRIPIIALTAYAMKGDREKCLEAGMDSYISKPINSGKFYETIEKFSG